MNASTSQILDLRTDCIRWSDTRSQLPTDPQCVRLEGQVRSEEEWLLHVQQALSSISLRATHTQVWLPLRLFLFRFVKLPNVSDRKFSRMLELEMERCFPHRSETLVGCYFQLHRDCVERQIVIAAMHRTSLLNLSDQFREAGISSIRAFPSFFAALQSCSALDTFETTQHLICLEQMHACAFSRNNSAAAIRLIALEQPLGATTIRERTLANATLMEDAFRRMSATLQRESAEVSSGQVDWVAPQLDVESQRDLEQALLRGMGKELVREQRWMDSGLLAFSEASSSLPKEQELRMEGSDWPARSNTGKERVRRAMSLCLAMTPLIWGVGNQQSIMILRNRLETTQQQSINARIQSKSAADRLHEFTSRLRHQEGLLSRQKEQAALVRLIVDLQNAMLEVGDTWFETFEWHASPRTAEVGTVRVKLSGKFLLRQAPQQETTWRAALSDAEANLHLLQKRVLASSVVESIEQFRVNYSGIHRRVHVVPFELQLLLNPEARYESPTVATPLS